MAVSPVVFSIRQRSLVHRIAALALEYPDADLVARVPSMRTATLGLDEPFRSLLGRTLDHLDRTPVGQLEVEHAAASDQLSPATARHLCTVLDLAATAEAEAGVRLLIEHRAGLERLRLALTSAGSPYADALAAVCATLPLPADAGPSAADPGPVPVY